MGCQAKQRSVANVNGILVFSVLIVILLAGRRFLIATTGIISGRNVVERIVGVSSGGGKDASI